MSSVAFFSKLEENLFLYSFSWLIHSRKDEQNQIGQGLSLNVVYNNEGVTFEIPVQPKSVNWIEPCPNTYFDTYYTERECYNFSIYSLEISALNVYYRV